MGAAPYQYFVLEIDHCVMGSCFGIVGVVFAMVVEETWSESWIGWQLILLLLTKGHFAGIELYLPLLFLH